jgi:hypothetical protein
MPDNNGRTTGGITRRGFRPGQSGNPGGRPKGLARATRELLGDDGLTIVKLWVGIMNDPNRKTRDRLEASKLLAERGWGKAALMAAADDDEMQLLEANEQRIEGAARAARDELERLSGSPVAETTPIYVLAGTRP